MQIDAESKKRGEEMLGTLTSLGFEPGDGFGLIIKQLRRFGGLVEA